MTWYSFIKLRIFIKYYSFFPSLGLFYIFCTRILRFCNRFQIRFWKRFWIISEILCYKWSTKAIISYIFMRLSYMIVGIIIIFKSFFSNVSKMREMKYLFMLFQIFNRFVSLITNYEFSRSLFLVGRNIWVI